MNVLITGGAGFIGRRLAKEMVKLGNRVIVLDNLSPQIHHDSSVREELEKFCDFVLGDVRDRSILDDVLKDCEVVIHLAAETGTGQSMYKIDHYSDVNVMGTAALLQAISDKKAKNLQKIVVASSRAIYGEGKYKCRKDGFVYPAERKSISESENSFDIRCPICGDDIVPVSTTEESIIHPSSFYGLTKQFQEQMVLLMCEVFGIKGIALRYQNVYGPGQSLSNPYTGILAVFTNLARKNKDINVFEDGLESRDFIFIDDVVNATLKAALSDKIISGAYNVGTGKSTSVLEVAEKIVAYYQSVSKISVSGAFRVGDIRHNFASSDKLSQQVEFLPETSFSDGLTQFLRWADAFDVDDSGYEKSIEELKNKGLLRD